MVLPRVEATRELAGVPGSPRAEQPSEARQPKAALDGVKRLGHKDEPRKILSDAKRRARN